MWSRCSKAGIAMLVLAFPLSVHADCPGGTGDERYNPCPAAEDIAVPMPGGIEMIFRRVIIPGADFWAHDDRIFEIGDPQGGIFQSPQRVMIGGSFPEADQWFFLLGKYEVSKAQVVAVLGLGDLPAGLEKYAAQSGDPSDAKLKTLSGQELTDELAAPTRFLSWIAVQQFISVYNDWCFRDPNCAKALPKIDLEKAKGSEGAPGFFRLPTEVEWEYAARGPVGSANFKAQLPFDPQQCAKYAFAQPKAKGKPHRIGTLDPVNGFHDMFGNVQEFTLDGFQAEVGQGKVGALTARGGSFLTDCKDLRSSYRTEVRLYEYHLSGPTTKQGSPQVVSTQSSTTGFRLAIGSPVIPTEGAKSILEDQYANYFANQRQQTPAGRSLGNPDVLAGITMQSALNAIRQLTGGTTASNPQVQRELEKVRSQLETATRQLTESARKNCDAYLRESVFFVTLVARDQKEIEKTTRLIKILSDMPQTAVRQKQISDGGTRARITLAHVDQYLVRYLDKLDSFLGCDKTLAQAGLSSFDAIPTLTDLDRAAFRIVRRHYDEALQHGVNRSRWKEEIRNDSPLQAAA